MDTNDSAHKDPSDEAQDWLIGQTSAAVITLSLL
jgi:hypothetical protein